MFSIYRTYKILLSLLYSQLLLQSSLTIVFHMLPFLKFQIKCGHLLLGNYSQRKPVAGFARQRLPI